MKSLLKLFFTIVAIFMVILLIVNFSGILSVQKIEYWLTLANDVSPYYIAALIIILLWADILISTPTIIVLSLSGYFLGPFYGLITCIIGLTLAGSTGYAIGNMFGTRFLKRIIKSELERHEAQALFHKHGFGAIILSRALPMLPETCACLAGMSHYSFIKFISAWLIATLPYCLILNLAGHYSSIDNPLPSLLVAVSISILLWVAWFFYHKHHKI